MGSALIIGAFAAGLVLAKTDRGKDIEHEVYDVAQFFIPIFFVSVGAAVDLKAINPFAADTRQTRLFAVATVVLPAPPPRSGGHAAHGRPQHHENAQHAERHCQPGDIVAPDPEHGTDEDENRTLRWQ